MCSNIAVILSHDAKSIAQCLFFHIWEVENALHVVIIKDIYIPPVEGGGIYPKGRGGVYDKTYNFQGFSRVHPFSLHLPTAYRIYR